jgi:ligand-binding SRPBCC domain-containing protein
MIKVDVNTVIDAPVEKVWEFVSDVGAATLRDPSVVKVDWRPPAGVGTVAVITRPWSLIRTGSRSSPSPT